MVYSMIPKLYPKTETAFTSAGLGELSDTIECIVMEERNGEYTLSMTYPITGELYADINNDSIILAKPNIGHQPQPFRVYDISRPINGIVTVSAEHISYQTNSIPVFPFSADGIAEAVALMAGNSAVDNPFLFSTTKTAEGVMAVLTPASFRTLMGGSQGSLLDVYGGGEYLFDRWSIALQQQRGADNGVSIDYGINLTDLRQEENIASLVTGVAPYWQKDDVLVTLPEKVIEIITDYSYPRVQTLDLSGDFEDAPTVADLRARAEAYLDTTDLTVPKVSLTVSFVDLSRTDEYKDMLAAVSNVMLCDIVTVRFPRLGVDTKAKVIRTEFDVLKDRYTSIELGEPKASFTAAQYQLVKEIAEKPSVDFMLRAVESATSMITGNSGGNIVIRPKNNPQELLIMDTDDIATAQKVWRFNLSGWGYSSTGVNGPYRLAATADGAIVADFITAGTLNANIIKAGIISDALGKNSINLETGDVSMSGDFTATASNNTIIEMADGSIVLKIGGNDRIRIMQNPGTGGDPGPGVIPDYVGVIVLDGDGDVRSQVTDQQIMGDYIYAKGFCIWDQDEQGNGGHALGSGYQLLDNQYVLSVDKISVGSTSLNVSWQYDSTLGKNILVGT